MSEKEIVLQYLEVLRLAAYNSFNDRRSYEWKFALAIWTTLALIIAGLLQPIKADEQFPLHKQKYRIAALVVAGLIMLLHVYFNYGVARANMIDRKKVRNYADHIEARLAIRTTELQKEIDLQVANLPQSPRVIWWQWGHIVQIGLTFLLALIAALLFWVRAAPR
jgi:hypothetical protein